MSTEHKPAVHWRYGHVAWCYDALAWAYSLGAIGRSKRWHGPMVRSGMRVLYVGAGTGREVQESVSRGAEVTCLEPSARMRQRLTRRLADSSGSVRILSDLLEDHQSEKPYDLVVAHYFLNLFDRETMEAQLDRLLMFVDQGGRLVISDFASVTDRLWWERALSAGYYRAANWVGAGLRICAAHPIYDYAPLLRAKRLDVDERVYFGVLPGMRYEVLVASKRGSG